MFGCINERYWGGNYYEPPEHWCDKEYDQDYECGEECPYYNADDDFLYEN